MMKICKEKLAKYTDICIMLHFIKCDLFFWNPLLCQIKFYFIIKKKKKKKKW
jgi:hypothetical protein